MDFERLIEQVDGIHIWIVQGRFEVVLPINLRVAEMHGDHQLWDHRLDDDRIRNYFISVVEDAQVDIRALLKRGNIYVNADPTAIRPGLYMHIGETYLLRRQTLVSA